MSTLFSLQNLATAVMMLKHYMVLSDKRVPFGLCSLKTEISISQITGFSTNKSFNHSVFNMAFVTQTNSAEVAHHMADSDMFLSLYLGGEDSPDINTYIFRT